MVPILASAFASVLASGFGAVAVVVVAVVGLLFFF
jgi:hypothetical protein